jgi:hypothetical protein
MNSGIPDVDTQAAIEKQIRDKFTGSRGTKMILAFNESKDSASTIETLSADNLDEKFETLQKFIQEQIFISHRITSSTLIGKLPEGQGFSKTEFEESLSIYKEIVIKGIRRELEYGLSKLTKLDVKFIDKPEIKEEVTNE